MYKTNSVVKITNIHFWPTVLSVEPLARCVVCLSSVCLSVVCDVLYCGETVRPSQKLSEGANRKPGSKSWIFWSLPYFYFRFRRYSYRDGRFCLIFARTAKRSVLDGRNGLSSSKPLLNCVVRIETGVWVIRLHYVVWKPTSEMLLSIWLLWSGPRDHSAWAWPAMGTGRWALAVHSSQFTV